MSVEAAHSLDLGGEDDDEAFEEAMAVFEGEEGLELFKAWDGISAILLEDLGERTFWSGEPIPAIPEAAYSSANRVAEIYAAMAGLDRSTAEERLERAISAGDVSYPLIDWTTEDGGLVRTEMVDLAIATVDLYAGASAQDLGVLALML